MKIYIILITIFFFSGCSKFTQESTIKLQKETQNLKPIDKKLVYRTIKKEIDIYHKIGDENYKAGYNYDALIAYEKVNFYEGYDAIPKSKLDKIKKDAKTTTKYYYKKLKEYKAKDKKQRLYILNKIIMNNPDYKDSKKLFEDILQDNEIKTFLHTLQDTLYMELLNNKNSTKNLIKINKTYLTLIKYNYKDKIAKKAKKVLKERYDFLLKKAINNYKKGNLTLAKKEFTNLTTIYKHQNTTRNYLLKIKTKQNIRSKIKLAKKALANKNYIEAIKLTDEIIKIEPKNKEVKKIRLKAKNSSNKEIQKLIHNGIKYYELKNLDEAQKSFKKVLKLESDNNTALIYTKKIHRQLQTIRSLKY